MISVFTKSRKVFFFFFLSPFRTVQSAIHMQVTDRPSPDAPSLTQALIVQMIYCLMINRQNLLGFQLHNSHVHIDELKGIDVSLKRRSGLCSENSAPFFFFFFLSTRGGRRTRSTFPFRLG